MLLFSQDRNLVVLIIEPHLRKGKRVSGEVEIKDFQDWIQQ